MNFGEYIKTKRIQEGFTLRAFCRKFDYDAAYVSRLETNKALPPSSDSKLEELATSLNIDRDSADWKTFHDLAAQSHDDLPPDIKREAPELLERLPAFLRTGDNKKISKDRVKKLLNFLNQEFSE